MFTMNYPANGSLGRAAAGNNATVNSINPMNSMNPISTARMNGYTPAWPSMEQEITTACVGLDTCALVLWSIRREDNTQDRVEARYVKCRNRQAKVFRELEYLCTARQKQIWVSQAVVDEVEALKRDANPYKQNMAENAGSFLLHMQQRGLLRIIPYVGDGSQNADHEILLILEQLRATSAVPLTLLTQDHALAMDAARKNATACVNGQEIRVYRFDMGGNLREFDAEDSAGQYRQVQGGWQPSAPVMGGFGPSRPVAAGGYGGMQPSAPVNSAVTGGFGPSRPVAAGGYGGMQPSAPVNAGVTGGFGPSRPAAAAVRQYTPASTKIEAPALLSYAPVEIATKDCPVPAEGAKVYTMDGTEYTLGKKFSEGGEAILYRLVEDDSLLVKIYRRTVSHAQAYKIATLAAMEKIPGAVLPVEMVYTAAEKFAGYTMPLIKDAVPLVQTFDPAWREEQQNTFSMVDVFDWNREEYARAAVNHVRITRALYDNGVIVTDANLQNVLVGKDQDGKYSADELMLIDLDSAQLLTDEGVIAGGGVTEDFCPAEIAAKLPFSTDMLFSESDLVANLAMQTFMTIMIGVHPYARAENDAGFSRAAARGEFPYSLTGKRSQFDTLDKGHTYLFSNLPTKLKEMYFNLLHGSGDMFKGDRISLAGLQRGLEHYLRWLGDPATCSRFPEAKSLTPSSIKPFTHACTCEHCTTGRPGEIYRVVSRTEELTEGTVLKLGQDQFYCPACYQHMMEQRKHARASAQHRWPPQDTIGWP